MSEASRRRLQLGARARQGQQPRGSEAARAPVKPSPAPIAATRREPEPEPSEEQDHVPLIDRRRRADGGQRPAPEAASSRAAGKRPIVDLDEAPPVKKARTSEAPRAVFAAEEEGLSSEPVTLACPAKTVQFANHMILGSQMELSELEELPKKLLREEAGRAFRLQASASMDMWLCVKRAISAAERAKKAYDDGKAKVAEAGRLLQDHSALLREKESAERRAAGAEKRAAEAEARAAEAEKRANAAEDSLSVAQVSLESAVQSATDAAEAKAAIQVVLEDSEKARAAEVESAVRQAIAQFRSSEEFTVLLDQEVGLEMVDLIYRFKRLNPGVKLNLNFGGEFPPLPEGITEAMVEAYEGEDAGEPAADGPSTAGA